MDLNDKEVYFYYYCDKCVNKDTDDAEDPCDHCLSEPSNTNSHVPVDFEPANGFEDYIYPENAPDYHKDAEKDTDKLNRPVDPAQILKNQKPNKWNEYFIKTGRMPSPDK